MFKVPEKYRIKDGAFASRLYEDGNNGVFLVPIPQKKPLRQFTVIASDGGGYEHVSVSLNDRTPTWGEMCAIKSVFWGVEDCVMQLHPPQKDYINNHPYCLHLWRPINEAIPMPPWQMVGAKCG